MKIKDIFLVFLVAVIAGFVAVFAYTRLTPETVREVPYSQAERHPAWFTNLPRDYQPAELDFTYAAEKTIHGVVHVTTMRERERGRDPIHEFFFGPQRGREPEPVQGIGSGVIVTDDGYIVTNNHVIDGATTIEVTLNDRRSFEARVVGTDPSTDLALLKIESNGLSAVEFGNSDALRIGEWVLAVGNPMNLHSTVTAGIVSAKARGLGILAREHDLAIESFIQTDAAVNRGNSGGALVNLRGELVGIPTLILSPTGAHAGNAFAIPVSIVRKVVEDIIEFGEVQRALLGVRIQGVTAELAREQGLDDVEGVYVAEATEGGAARDAGIREGDVILAINGVRVNTVPELQEQIAMYRPNDKIEVRLRRNGRTQQITATLRNIQGSTEVVRPQEVFLGASFRPVPEDIKKELNIDHGAQITNLGPGPFRSQRVRENFIILSINNQAVREPADVRNILEGHEGGVYIEGIYPDGTAAYYAFGL